MESDTSAGSSSETEDDAVVPFYAQVTMRDASTFDAEDKRRKRALDLVERLSTLRSRIPHEKGKVHLDIVQESPAWREYEDEVRDLTPEKFVETLNSLGPEEKQISFLDILAVPVVATASAWTKLSWQKTGHVLPYVHLTKNYNKVCDTCNNWSLRTVFDTSGAIRHSYAYSSAWQILHPTDAGNTVYILKALCECDFESSVFHTVIGRALVSSSWRKIEMRFWAGRLLDMAFLVNYMIIGYYIRNRLQPDLRTVLFLGLGSILTCLRPVVDLCSMYRLYGMWMGLRKYLTGWNLSIVLIEVYSVCIGLWVLLETDPGGMCDPLEEDTHTYCWYQRHPIVFSILVGVKWFHFNVSMLCTTLLGSQVIPAYATLISKASLSFGVFVFMCVAAVFFSYYVIPIEENMVQGPSANLTHSLFAGDWVHRESYWPIMRSVVKVFRLTVMGEFDTWSLEGVDPQMVATEPWPNATGEGTHVGIVDEGDGDARIHVDLRLWLMVVVFVINTLLLNVYIGLLSSIYTTFAQKRYQLHAQFRATFAFKELLRESCACSFGCALSMLQRFFGLGPPTCSEQPNGVMIAYNHNRFKDEDKDCQLHDRDGSITELRYY